jgi:hypothetical protein
MARVEGGILYAERYLSASMEYFMASMELTTCNTTSVTDQITDELRGETDLNVGLEVNDNVTTCR